MSIYYRDDRVTLYHGDCIEVMASLPDASVDAVVTDPPYALGFMGRSWDTFGDVGRGAQARVQRSGEVTPGGEGHSTSAGPYLASGVDSLRSAGAPFQAWCEQWAREALRVLKPGGHLLAFGGTRTWHRLACAVEDAGFEVRDSIAWMYGSGFPKSLDVSKAIDKAAGAERGRNPDRRNGPNTNPHTKGKATFNGGWAPLVGDDAGPQSPDAERWQGWGTALKPAHEPVVCARKPFNAVPLDWRLVANVHHALAGLLWLSLSPAKRVELSSPSSQVERDGAWCASALVSVALNTSRDGYDETATYSSPATASTASSIASSWSSILGALSAPTRTFTTSTASSTTTALRTLNSLLGPITSQTTMPKCGCLLGGPSSPAPSVASSSSDEWARWLHTLSASVPATATEGIALAVASALAQVAESLSADLEAGSSAAPSATTGAAARGNAPAFEPVVVARKPLVGTVAGNVLTHGTGALNIDACRIESSEVGTPRGERRGDETDWRFRGGSSGSGATSPSGRWPANVVLDESQAEALDEQSGERSAGGRPASAGITSEPGAANGTMGGAWSGVDRAEREVLDKGGASRFFFVASHDKGDTSALTGKGGRIESCETASTAAESSSPPRQFGDSALGGAVTSEHPDTASQTGSPSTSATPSGSRPSGRPATPTTQNIDAESSPEQQPGERTPTASPASSVGPSAPTVTTTTTTSPSTSAGSAAPATSDTTSQWKALGDTDSAPFKYVAKADATERPRVNGTAHPTVKPLALMRWLVRLVTPPGGTVLEPFAGSGTTVEACLLEGFRCIAIEKTDEYLSLTVARIYRQRHPVEAVKLAGDDLGLFAHIDEEVTC